MYNILVVDDIGIVTYQLKLLLRNLGYNVHIAKDIFGALLVQVLIACLFHLNFADTKAFFSFIKSTLLIISISSCVKGSTLIF